MSSCRQHSAQAAPSPDRPGRARIEAKALAPALKHAFRPNGLDQLPEDMLRLLKALD